MSQKLWSGVHLQCDCRETCPPAKRNTYLAQTGDVSHCPVACPVQSTPTLRALAQTSHFVQIRRSSFPQGVFSISQADAFDKEDAIFRIDALISGSICERCRTM